MGELILLLVPEGPRLSTAVLERLSAISADAAQVALASVVIPTLLDRGDVTLIALGSGATAGLWIVSLLLTQHIK